MIKRLFFLSALLCFALLCFALPVMAQQRGADNSSSIIPDFDKRQVAPGSPEDEIYQRAAIRRDEAIHKETVERAQEGAQIGLQLRASFEQKSSLGPEELKKLDRLERLAKKIRGNAGGSDDVEPLQNIPQEVGAALRMLAEAAEDLQKKVEKTSRLVTSAAVIQRSNEVIELSKHVRNLFR